MKKWLIIFLLFGTIFSLNISNYLYPNENISDLKIEKIESSAENYFLYYLKQVPILLADSSDNIIKDETEIRNIVNSHYQKTILPSSEELNKFKEYIMEFNKSRNLPLYQISKIKSNYKSEDFCLQTLLLDKQPCFSLEQCKKTSSVLCALYSYQGVDCNPYIMAEVVYDYYSSIIVLNNNTNLILSSIDEIDLKNAKDKFSDIKLAIAKLRQAAKNIEKSNLTDPTSLGICIKPVFNYSALDLAENQTDNYLSRIGPLQDLESTSKIIKENTEERTKYASRKELLDKLKPKWEEIKTKYNQLLVQATEYKTYYADKTFADSYTNFYSAWSLIEQRFENYNPENIEENIAIVNKEALKLSDILKDKTQPYKQALEAKQRLEAIISTLKYSINKEDADSLNKLNEIIKAKQKVDLKFTPPLKKEVYQTIKEEYEQIEKEALEIKSAKASSWLDKTTAGFGQASIDLFFKIFGPVLQLGPNEKIMVSGFIPAIALILVILILFGIFSLIFFILTLKFRLLLKKKNIAGLWIGLFFILIFLIGLGAVGVYIVMDSALKKPTLDSFLELMRKADKTIVVIKTTNVNKENLESMQSCALNVSKIVSSKYQKVVSIVELAQNSCTFDSKKLDYGECIAQISNYPQIEFNYDPQNNIVEIAPLYEKKMSISSKKDYFEKCEIANILN